MADAEKDRKVIDAAVDFLHRCTEAEGTNRQEGLEALRFSKLGQQWPAEIQNSRQLESRPCLTINKVEAFCKQVTNQQRQQRPRIKVHAVNDIADVKIADIIAGICRHIEVNSNADTAYDTAFDSTVHIGWGYWRIVTDYTKPDSFDQDIYIHSIDNPFSVYFDPNSVLPDGSDAEECLITDLIPRKAFKRQYPNAEDGSGFTQTGLGDNTADWITPEDVRVAEYFYVERKTATLCLLSDKSKAWKDDLPNENVLAQKGLEIVSERESYKQVVKWCKLTMMEVLEEREWAGRWIPVVPVYGDVVVIDGKRQKYGLVKHAKDPQVLYNFQRTAEIESIGMAPKAKWLMAAGQDEGFEQEWLRANVSALPILHYNKRDINSEECAAPERLQPEPPPTGLMESALTASQDLTSVLGIVDPAMRISGNVSGKALNSEKQQSDNSNFHYYDNLTRSICHTGKIILDLIPKIYDSERVIRIIGEDGRPSMENVNQPNPDDPMGKLLNDVTVGEYDVVMDTGPGYNSKRIEATEAMMPLMANNEELFKVAGDLVFRNMDFPGAEQIADRLAAANPLAQIDEKSPVPPQAQMKLKQQEQQIQQMQQMIQSLQMEMKHKGSIVQMQEESETNREHMRLVSKAHDVEAQQATKLQANREDNAAWMHDTQIKAHTALSVAEINAMRQLLSDRLGHDAAEKLQSKVAEEEKEIA